MGTTVEAPWSMAVLVDRSTVALLTPLPAPEAGRARYRLTAEPAVRLEVRGPLHDLWDRTLVAWIRFAPDPGDGEGAAGLAGRLTPRVELDPERAVVAPLGRPPVVLSGLLRRLIADARERLEEEAGGSGPRPWRPTLTTWPAPPGAPGQAADQRKS
jgi:hypothetical protein